MGKGTNMKARDLYGLLVRVAGLVFIAFAVFDLTHLIALMIGMQMASQYPASVLALATGIYLVVGLVLTFGAGSLTRLVYGRDNSN